MQPPKKYNRNRIIFVILVVSGVLAYPKVNAWTHDKSVQAEAARLLDRAAAAFFSSAPVASVKRAFGHADKMITGSSVAAEEEARASARGEGGR